MNDGEAGWQREGLLVHTSSSCIMASRLYTLVSPPRRAAYSPITAYMGTATTQQTLPTAKSLRPQLPTAPLTLPPKS